MCTSLKKKIMLVFGTRPEAIKMCPLVNELKARSSIETLVVVTGQHRQMLAQVLEVFHVIPDYDLSIMKEKQSLFDITINVLDNLKGILEETNPDVVLVHGDTNTTFANEYMDGETTYKYYNDMMWPKRFAKCISLNEAINLFRNF